MSRKYFSFKIVISKSERVTEMDIREMCALNLKCYETNCLKEKYELVMFVTC